MKLSTKGRYAVTAMMDIALHEKVGPVTLADISQCQGISLSYLEQLFSKLRRNGLVKGVRGPGGGYRLAKPASEISVADIIDSVDEKLDLTKCGGKGNCNGNRNSSSSRDGSNYNNILTMTTNNISNSKSRNENNSDNENNVYSVAGDGNRNIDGGRDGGN